MSHAATSVRIESRNDMIRYYEHGDVYNMIKAQRIEEIYAAFEPYPLDDPREIQDFFCGDI